MSRKAWKRNSTETTVSAPTRVLRLNERTRKSAVMMLLCASEKQIVTDITTM